VAQAGEFLNLVHLVGPATPLVARRLSALFAPRTTAAAGRTFLPPRLRAPIFRNFMPFCLTSEQLQSLFARARLN
jgi:hypothetical protein